MGERQRTARTEEMATTSTAVSTVSPQIQEEAVERVAVITLRPAAGAGTDSQTRKKVVWTDDTVDNEHMNKKKSKCCCIYEKPRRFDESDSESSDDECEHCYGHVEKRHTHAHTHERQSQHEPAPLTINEDQVDSVPAEHTATIILQPPQPAPAPPDSPPAS